MLYRNASAQHPEAAHRVESPAMFYASIGDAAGSVSLPREAAVMVDTPAEVIPARERAMTKATRP